ncbi:MAG: hypothetical protein K1X74_17795 [Pirellulales bacterium]|nr:hypothetical protein [Pirellulales bacterium]
MRAVILGIVLGALPAVTAAAAEPAIAAGKLIVAHRGASGYLPEHTLPAYALAHAQGADYIEPDVVLSKDGVLVCNHDIHAELTTDVAERFPDRRRADGHWYFLDFTLAELKTLAVRGRKDPPEPGYSIPTLEEMLLLVQRLNERTGRRAGTIPELKSPGWHRAQGAPLEPPFLEMYARFGCTKRSDNVIVQCFEPDSLRRMRAELHSDLTQLFLLPGPLPEAKMDEVAAWADMLGPARAALERDAANQLVAAAHRHGLKVIPYTFQRDADAIRRFLYELDVDGVFTDFPDVGVAARAAGAASD